MIFHENRLPADDSHEIPRLILLFLKKQQNLKLSSAANYRWRFKGYVGVQHMIQVGMCIQRRFESTCASTQSDQSLSLPSEEMLDRVPIEDADQTARANFDLLLDTGS